MQQPKVVTLLSDFGLKDSYVAEMKAIILTICPEAKIVDISHEVDKFDIHMGAFILASVTPFFPEGTVHVAVVDPGVGTQRRPIIAKTRRSLVVGPDNGLLMLAALREGLREVHVIEDPRFMLLRVSETFHGRDVFAPAAAHLALGVDPSELGQEIRNYVIPEFANPVLKSNTVFGEVVHVDGFGNIITNISSDVVKKVTTEGMPLRVKTGRKAEILRLCSTYGEVAKGKSLLVIGSHGFLEISVNRGSAARLFDIRRGDPVLIRRRA